MKAPLRISFQPVAASGVTAWPQGRFNWKVSTRESRFELISPKGRFPGDWVRVETDLEGVSPGALKPVLYVQTSMKPGEKVAISLVSSSGGEFLKMILLPPGHSISSLTLAPGAAAGPLRLNHFRLRELNAAELAVRSALPAIPELIRGGMRRPRHVLHLGWLALRTVSEGGYPALKRKLSKRLLYSYARWVKSFDTLTESDRQAIRAHSEKLPKKPKISVILPVYNVEEAYLRSAIDSVRRQLYPNWELCIADDCSPKPHIRKVLEEYAQLDPARIRVTFREKNGHIVAASNSALELATGEYVAFLDHDDELTEHALYMMAEEIGAHPDAQLIYSDEDKIDTEGNRFDPHFKSDWNPDLFYSLNLITHLAVYRTELVRSLGGLRLGCEGSQDYDLVLRVTERIPESQIRHIPHILYHWRAIPGSTALGPQEKDYAHEAGRRAIQEHFDRTEVPATVVRGWDSFHRVIYPVPEPAPLISIVIPTRDQVVLLAQTVRGILEQTSYPSVEILIVDNQSREQGTLDYFKSIQMDSRVRILKYDHPFNYSAINNSAVREARGELVGLMNNDLKVISPGWLREMVSHALRPEIGAVGAKLYYADETIQHAGVIVGIGGVAGHSHKHVSRSNAGVVGRLQVIQALSAVTAACLVVRREVYDEVGGLDEEHLKVAFNDVDFCLRLRERGYRNLFTPYAELYHLEGASRGVDMRPENAERFKRESDYMKARWGAVLASDPYYNPNLSIYREDFALAFPPRVRKPWLSP